MFADVFALLFAAHVVGDHIVQTEHQAITKRNGSLKGHLACARHVATYTGTAVVALLAGNDFLELRLPLWPTVIGLGISAVTHYVADLRGPLAWFARITGHAGFYRQGLPGSPDEAQGKNMSPASGAYLMDQAWHIGWLAIAALVIAA